MGRETRGLRGVRPPLAPIAPAFDRRVLALVHAALPLLLRLRLFPWLPAGITGLEVVDGDTLSRCLHRFHAGQIRLILAVRHAEVDDPLSALWLLSRDQPRRARRLGLAIGRPVHAHFLFDRGMTLWAGAALGWLLGRLGGVSLRRGRHPDWTALRQARRLVLEGRFPFALAPEGATNGHGERIGPLEPGGAQLGLWCLEDLQRDGRGEEVLILPIALQYRYARPDWPALARLMGRLERSLGLPPWRDPLEAPAPDPAALHRRLVRLGDALMGRLEGFYALESAPALERGERIARLLDRALATAEGRLRLAARGTPEDRCRRLEEAIWSRVYPDDLPPLGQLSPLDRGLADWRAVEASLAERHMRLAECFGAVSGRYVEQRPSYERFMETTLLIHDALSRLRGDRLPARPRLGARCVRLSVAAPLSVQERLQALRAAGNGERSRRLGRAVIASLNDDIRRSFEGSLI
ncbi:MAG: 1-acyl-sn-glycerol-3-phosphate acyltransferase [Cyanobium sp.]